MRSFERMMLDQIDLRGLLAGSVRKVGAELLRTRKRTKFIGRDGLDKSIEQFSHSNRKRINSAEHGIPAPSRKMSDE